VKIGLSVTSRAQAVPQIKIVQAVDISNVFIGRSSIVLVQQLLGLPRCCRQHAEMVKESLRPCEFGGHPGGSAGLDRFPGLAGAFGTKTRAGQVETIQVAEADGAGFGADRRRSFSQGAGRARPAIFAVHHLALVINARGLGL
jgi:hypothetical protein